MNEPQASPTPTPETDAFISDEANFVSSIERTDITILLGKWADHARRLERQRDQLARALRIHLSARCRSCETAPSACVDCEDLLAEVGKGKKS